jgi:predicted nucleic-acid-binding protein
MPLAVDTNVLARALTDDGSEQSRRAFELLRDEEILVPDTVLLETEWMLRSTLKMRRGEINDLFSALLAAPKVVFADRKRIADCLIAHKDGLDFADAMHLHAAQACESMITYDEDFIRRSKNIAGTIPVRKP